MERQPPGTLYRIDETQSELRVLVYRAGALARLGHNHVMVNRALSGAVNRTDGASAFWLKVPAAGFTVDESQARQEEGSDFNSVVSDEAKSATLQHMLSTAVLDADEFPLITLRSSAVSGSMVATVVVGIAGHESTVDVPFALQMEAGRLLATGSVELRQTALGLTPYSLMLGALQVQDAMTVKFKIAAIAVDALPQGS